MKEEDILVFGERKWNENKFGIFVLRRMSDGILRMDYRVSDGAVTPIPF